MSEPTTQAEVAPAPPVMQALLRRRLGFGVQDFGSAVQPAVQRVQSLERVQRLMRAARALGFQFTNVDLIYGLPRQTPASLARTVVTVAAPRPDRIALYHCAHLPQRVKPQRCIDERAPPSPEDKLVMLSQAITGFAAQGYSHIGMDHFALPQDSLAAAKRPGRLHGHAITVTPLGWDFVRAVAMVFDRYPRATAERSHFSRVP